MKKLISILGGIACFALISVNVLIGTHSNSDTTLNVIFSNSIANAEPGEPPYRCFVGTRGTSGTIKIWCGDCLSHYVENESGDGWCGG